ncbi:MAG: SDR family oxidoreductase [Pirellulales bacterium]
MAYKLLTGSTGLLGRYLLRDLLIRNFRVALLVRPTRFETAEQRIDSILRHWEEEWGVNLPRPVVFSGDLTEPMLGLSTQDQEWLRENCDSVLHSAASLTFQEKDGEPWNSNVHGVSRLLELCRETNIKIVEQVSSSYVCGLRTGTVCESELDVGQEFGNDYEKSKVESEKLVQQDPDLESYTIFRPSIITGDSQTGFTPTYHGFYTPLRILQAFLTQINYDELFGTDHLGLLGLQGDEGKNLVPVDWVSDAIVSIISRQPPCRKTYGIASPYPVTTSRMLSVFAKSLKEFAGNSSKEPTSGDLQGDAYVDQLAVYQSYWRDDPVFDCTNTLDVLPDKKCPEFSDETLLGLCRYALQSKFGWYPSRTDSFKPLVRSSIRNWIECKPAHIQNKISASSTVNSFGLIVTGTGGGSWTLGFESNELTTFKEGLKTSSNVRLSSKTFQEICQGHLTIDQAVNKGSVIYFGSPSSLRQFDIAMKEMQST